MVFVVFMFLEEISIGAEWINKGAYVNEDHVFNVE